VGITVVLDLFEVSLVAYGPNPNLNPNSNLFVAGLVAYGTVAVPSTPQEHLSQTVLKVSIIMRVRRARNEESTSREELSVLMPASHLSKQASSSSISSPVKHVDTHMMTFA